MIQTYKLYRPIGFMLKYLSRSDSQDANMQKLQIANKWATETILYT